MEKYNNKQTNENHWPKIRTVIRQTREYGEVEWCTFLKIRRVVQVKTDADKRRPNTVVFYYSV